MAGYRRFIAYVYEYKKGKKEKNCGFMKVEVRERVCTIEIHLQVAGLAAGDKCKIYGFVRKDGLINGIQIGDCNTEKNKIDCQVETDGTDMGGSGTPLGKMGGMILITQTGGFFGTEWDDQAIRPENFKEIGLSAKKEYGKEEIAEKEKTSEIRKIAEAPVATEKEEKTEIKTENEIRRETEGTTETKREKIVATELEKNSESEKIPEPEKTTEQIAESKATVEQEAPVKIPPAPEEIPEKEDEMRAQEAECEKEQATLPFGKPFCPFSDGDLQQCWQITPQDLVHFPRRQCAMRNNRFLQYGYYNFGHILLCRKQNGRYILGVPGSYDQQEQFMAGMFGFSCFKESSYIKVKKGRGGYWYRAIDPPACTGTVIS
ncbi:DUF6128 domain-containing protein [Blautia sp. HCP3S3_H10_1]|uniref:DUF6128 domain-containing protein n=1 Tax=unclassified Blautia TaxID=2648079 RepID=UPI003F8E6919